MSEPIVDPYFPKQDKYKVGMIIYDEFTMLDLMGPAEIIGFDKDMFQCQMIGKAGKDIVKSYAGVIKYYTDKSLEEASQEDWDLILIPGGMEGTQRIRKDKEFIEQLTKVVGRTKVVFTICTGSLVLAETGVLEDHHATTNKMGFSLTEEFPKIKWIHQARWVHNKKFITSSGITAGMDAALYIISLIKGEASAKELSRNLEYLANWDPKQDPFAKKQ